VGVEKVQLLSIPVSDPDRSKAFYADVLGMEVVQDTRMGPDMRWLMLRPPGAATAVTLVTWFPTMPAGSLKGLVLEAPDLDGTLAELTARGLRVDGPIEDQPWGRFVTFEDPDGNGLILQSTRD
jgi:catechol 2,3-dioxygenase-like lactoylglutathione lyase family enzyme